MKICPFCNLPSGEGVICKYCKRELPKPKAEKKEKKEVKEK